MSVPEGLIDGILLGDGSLEASNVAARLRVPQSGDRRPWVLSLKAQLTACGIECSTYPIRASEVTIKGKTCQRKASLVLSTRYYVDLKTQWKRWYVNGVKRIPLDVSLTPLAIAQWVMGDGTVGGRGARFLFCTDGFDSADVSALVERLNTTFGWHSVRDGRNRVRLCQTSDRISLVEMVRPFVEPCFDYKLHLKMSDQRYKITDAVQDAMLELRAAGHGYGAIASRLGLSKSGVHSALTRCRENSRAMTSASR
jgi:hypothetical protein